MNKIKGSTIIFILVGIWIVISIMQIGKTDKELEKYGVETVAKTTRFVGKSKQPYVDYIFVVDGKEYLDDSPREKKPYEKVKHFYKLIYSSRNPKINKIYMDKEIIDTTLIMKAGFKKYTKINKYDLYGNFLYTKDTLYFKR